MNKIEEFKEEVKNNIKEQGEDSSLRKISNLWFNDTLKHKYSYNFTWMGRPIIQYPQDIVAMQEIIWNIKPDLIIETGIAHGGSIIFYASMLELIGGDGEVVGIDIDIRSYNRAEIEKHPMSKRIKMVEGSSIEEKTLKVVNEYAKNKKRILVVLDSNHTHEHVKKELELYSKFVKKDSYLVVFDTCVEDMPEELVGDRPWGKGNNPKTAVIEFLTNNDRFEIDKSIEEKLLVTVAPSGYLKCVKNI